MGADNWAICPKCKLAAEAESAKKQEEVGAAYGKVEPETYREMFADAAKPVELQNTLREDYGLGISEDGKFSVSYRGHCGKCGFDHRFKHEEELIETEDA